MDKITTNKYFVHLTNINSIDRTSLIFLIDDGDEFSLDNIVPEEILLHIISSLELSTIKKEITLLIKYLIVNFDTYHNNKHLKIVVEGISDPKLIPFLGYFSYLYNNLINVKKKYKRKDRLEYHIYYYDKYYLD
tara:strand:+ start:1548 stop:1949 length:402 start_codon:yes stop_codon:yes gene_type:complete